MKRFITLFVLAAGLFAVAADVAEARVRKIIVRGGATKVIVRGK